MRAYVRNLGLRDCVRLVQVQRHVCGPGSSRARSPRGLLRRLGVAARELCRAYVMRSYEYDLHHNPPPPHPRTFHSSTHKHTYTSTWRHAQIAGARVYAELLRVYVPTHS